MVGKDHKRRVVGPTKPRWAWSLMYGDVEEGLTYAVEPPIGEDSSYQGVYQTLHAFTQQAGREARARGWRLRPEGMVDGEFHYSVVPREASAA